MNKMNSFVNKKLAETEIINMGYIHERNSVVCPYCYESMPFDSSDFDNDLADFADKEWHCEHCEKDFLVDGDIQYTFNSYSRRIKDE